jgi:hypothetical protein
MTNEELKAYYASLLILQYKNKAKAQDTIEAIVDPLIMDQLPFAVQDAFNVDTAVGVQLDVLGVYAGVIRQVLTFTGSIILDDDDFRVLIKMKMIQNNNGSSLADIQSLIADFFPGSLSVFDYANMSMDYYFDSDIGSVDLAEAFVREGLLPKPMGVQLGALIYVANLHNIFGMRTYLLPPINVSGFNTYADYQMDRPWISHANAIVF